LNGGKKRKGLHIVGGEVGQREILWYRNGKNQGLKVKKKIGEKEKGRGHGGQKKRDIKRKGKKKKSNQKKKKEIRGEAVCMKDSYCRWKDRKKGKLEKIRCTGN